MAGAQRPHVTTLRLSDDEREALDALGLVEHEERTGGDILRRALRAYAPGGRCVARDGQAPPRRGPVEGAMGEVREPNQGTLLKEALRDVLARFDFTDTNLRNIAMGEVIMRMVRCGKMPPWHWNFISPLPQVGSLDGDMPKTLAHEIIDVLRIVGFGMAGDDEALATMAKAAGQVIAKARIHRCEASQRSRPGSE